MTFVHNFHYQTFFTCCCIMFKDYLYVDCALMLAFPVEQILADLYQSFSDTCDCPFFSFLIFVYNIGVPSEWHKEDRSVHLIIVGPEVWVNASLYVIIYLYNILICFQYCKKASNTLPFFLYYFIQRSFSSLTRMSKTQKKIEWPIGLHVIVRCVLL